MKRGRCSRGDRSTTLRLYAASVLAPARGAEHDAGRRSEGIASCPNGVSDPNRMREVVGHAPDEQVATVLSFGYPARSWNPEARPAEEWISRANRRPFDEIVERR